MIEAMRSTVAKWAIRFLLFLLIISFGVWGIEDMFRPPAVVQNVATVEGETISRDQLYERFQRVVNAMRERLGAGFDNRQAARLGLLDRTLDEMIEARLLSKEVARLDLDAGEDIIRQAIFNDPRFKGPGNNVDRIAFQNFLRQEGLSEGMFVSILRDQIRRNQLLSALTAANQVPRTLLDTVYKFRNEQRTAEIVTVPFQTASSLPAPDEASLKKYYEENKQLFLTPEYRDITAIYLDPAEVGAGMSPPEERIQETFEARKEAASVPERRNLSQILVLKEDILKKLTSSLDGGANFEEAAKAATGKPPQALGNLTRNDLPAPVAEVAFGIRENEIGEPVKTSLGWHVVRVNKIAPGRVATMAELRPAIIKDLAREMAIDDIIVLTGRIDDALAAGSPLEDAASSVGASVFKFSAVDALGNGKGGKPVKDFPASPRFRDLATSLEPGESSLIEEADDGSYFVLRVDRVIAPEVPPLAEIRSRVIAAWKDSQVQNAAEEKAKALLEAAKQKGLKIAAAEQGLPAITAKPFSRFIRNSDIRISDALSSAIFKAKQDALVSAPDLKGYSVAKVTQIIAATPGGNKAEADALKNSIEQSLAQDMGEQLLGQLRKRYKVEINREAMQRLTEEQLGG